MKRIKTQKCLVMQGVCFAHNEQGLEGTHWSFQENGYCSYDQQGRKSWSYKGLRPLLEGDIFTVWNHRNQKIFDDVIVYDTTTNLQETAVWDNANRVWKPSGQYRQFVNGLAVHWLQAGIDPKIWANFFAGGNLRSRIKRLPINPLTGCKW